MIILKSTLTKDDHLYLAYYLKYLMLKRQKLDTKKLEPMFLRLAEGGQIECLEMYYNSLASTDAENIKIFHQIRKIEETPLKSPRENMALASYYKWQLRRSRVFKTPIEKMPQYGVYVSAHAQAMNQLIQVKNLDDTAQEYLLEKAIRKKQAVNPIALSNFRNMLYDKAKKQVNDDKRNKLLLAYSKNIILFASDSEFNAKVGEIEGLISEFQKCSMCTPPQK